MTHLYKWNGFYKNIWIYIYTLRRTRSCYIGCMQRFSNQFRNTNTLLVVSHIRNSNWWCSTEITSLPPENRHAGTCIYKTFPRKTEKIIPSPENELELNGLPYQDFGRYFQISEICLLNFSNCKKLETDSLSGEKSVIIRRGGGLCRGQVCDNTGYCKITSISHFIFNWSFQIWSLGCTMNRFTIAYRHSISF